MIGVPMNPNSVYISVIQTGCCKGEFDSTYPIHLNGVISQDEFRESVYKINQTISSSGSLILVTVIFILTTVAGVVCSVMGGLTAADSSISVFQTLIGLGIAINVCGTLFFVFGFIFIQVRRTRRLREAVAEESMKYSTRLPVPCSWRLETTSYFGGWSGNNNNRLLYHIVIDIGRSATPGTSAYYSNQNSNESSFITRQQNNYAPPPYSSPSTEFCSRCGASQKDFSARFCSSCGQAFNKH